MNFEHEQRFMALVEQARIPVDVMDALRHLIEDVADKSFDNGLVAGAEPFNTSWPSSQSS